MSSEQLATTYSKKIASNELLTHRDHYDDYIRDLSAPFSPPPKLFSSFNKQGPIQRFARLDDSTIRSSLSASNLLGDDTDDSDSRPPSRSASPFAVKRQTMPTRTLHKVPSAPAHMDGFGAAAISREMQSALAATQVAAPDRCIEESSKPKGGWLSWISHSSRTGQRPWSNCWVKHTEPYVSSELDQLDASPPRTTFSSISDSGMLDEAGAPPRFVHQREDVNTLATIPGSPPLPGTGSGGGMTWPSASNERKQFGLISGLTNRIGVSPSEFNSFAPTTL